MHTGYRHLPVLTAKTAYVRYVAFSPRWFEVSPLIVMLRLSDWKRDLVGEHKPSVHEA